MDDDPGTLQTIALGRIVALLEAILTATRYEIADILVGRFNAQELVVYDVPGPGSKRILVDRQGTGASGLAVASGVVSAVCVTNEGRVGGSIVNSGGSNVILYLCPSGDIGGTGNAVSGQAQNRPCIELNASGGAWDFRLGNALYGGHVCAVGQGGASTLSVAEF